MVGEDFAPVPWVSEPTVTALPAVGIRPMGMAPRMEVSGIGAVPFTVSVVGESPMAEAVDGLSAEAAGAAGAGNCLI